MGRVVNDIAMTRPAETPATPNLAVVPLEDGTRFHIGRLSFNLPTWVVIAATIVLLSLIAYADLVTPPALSLALFYLLPVAIATWFIGRRGGYCMAMVAAFVWLLVELHDVYPPQSKLITYLNAASRLGFFLFSVPVLSSWRATRERLARMVEARTAELRAEVVERQRAERSLRQLARQLSAAEDAERMRVAYDLHDGLSQMLSLTKINLQAAASEQASAATSTPPKTDRLNDSIKVLDSLIDQTRNLTFDLHPAMIDDLGLMATLNSYAHDFGKRTNTDVIVTEHGATPPVPSALAHYLFRATKEILNNAARHGHAKEIIIAVHWETGTPNATRIRIVIDDDGSGFVTADMRKREGPGGLGLPGISERLRSLGGGLHVESQPDQGARVILEAPLETDEPTGR